MAASGDNELAERLRLYQGAVEIIADVVRRADDPHVPSTDREGAWRTITSVLREVKKHTAEEKPPRQ